MDAHTLELLEFDRVRGLVASYAACSLGKAAARAMAPMTDAGAIREARNLTTEMTEALSAGLSPPLGGLRDVRGLTRRAMTGATLTAEELAEVVETLRAIAAADGWLARIGDQFPRLGGLRQGVGEFSGVASAIEGCVDARGVVLDTASRRLSQIRQEIGAVEGRIQEILRHLLRSPEIRKYLRYPNFTMVGHHYVLPVSKEHRGGIPGSVHRTSASNETVYIEPQAIAEQSAQLSYLRVKEGKEIQRILRWLSAQVGQAGESLLGTLENLGELDLIHARGRYSLDYGMAPPDFNEEGKLSLTRARHPLLEAFFREEAARGEPRREVTPIDVHLGFHFGTLIVTGPNTGGKTVALKTVGLLAIMAQCGLHIPAGQDSRLFVADHVLADIGDEQSLEQSLSTFSSHVRRISTILGTATERSLVLLDELGAGTDPAEGAALGRAILDELDSLGARAMVTTHIGDLKTYALTNNRAENAAVEFDLETLRPMYRLHIGDVGQSNALEIARRLRMPEHLVDRAKAYLEKARGPESPEWGILQKLRKEAEDAQAKALAAQAEAERVRDALKQKLADLQKRSDDEAKLAEARARLQPGDRVVVERFGYDRPGRVVKIDPRKRTARVSIGAMAWDVDLDEVIPQSARTPEAADPGKRPRVSKYEDYVEGD